MFEYDCKVAIMESVLLGNPTGDANSTKTSKFGFNKAADSIAHACLKRAQSHE